LIDAGDMPDLRQPKQNGQMVLLDSSCPADPFRLFPTNRPFCDLGHFYVRAVSKFHPG
jgi:hypothetical protein